MTMKKIIGVLLASFLGTLALPAGAQPPQNQDTILCSLFDRN